MSLATPKAETADRLSLLAPKEWHRAVRSRVEAGERFAALYARAHTEAGTRGVIIAVILVAGTTVDTVETWVPEDDGGEAHYLALTPAVPAAAWYERAAHDLSGVVPDGLPRPEPLLFHAQDGAGRPEPGTEGTSDAIRAAAPQHSARLAGRGLHTISLGPVRSGAFESIEFSLETLGEDIPQVTVRPHYKHRGVAKQFEGRDIQDGVLVAERVEGISSVAHALAFSHAVEAACQVEVPPAARLVRVVHAELERIANHLDSAMRLAEAAGLAVAVSRFSWHKEETMRLVGALSGSRFGRGVVIPGGVAHPLFADPEAVSERITALHRLIRDDLTLGMRTPSFIDRLRTTGILSPEKAARLAALGPLGRASGMADDCRWARPTDGYRDLPMPEGPVVLHAGDVMARANVRWEEIDHSVLMIREALRRLSRIGDEPQWSAPVEVPDGAVHGLGWAEAAQGEVLYALHLEDGRIVRCLARSASFHNLAIFSAVFGGDVFTDFAFIEGSFQLGYAGSAM